MKATSLMSVFLFVIGFASSSHAEVFNKIYVQADCSYPYSVDSLKIATSPGFEQSTQLGNFSPQLSIDEALYANIRTSAPQGVEELDLVTEEPSDQKDNAGFMKKKYTTLRLARMPTAAPAGCDNPHQIMGIYEISLDPGVSVSLQTGLTLPHRHAMRYYQTVRYESGGQVVSFEQYFDVKPGERADGPFIDRMKVSGFDEQSAASSLNKLQGSIDALTPGDGYNSRSINNRSGEGRAQVVSSASGAGDAQTKSGAITDDFHR